MTEPEATTPGPWRAVNWLVYCDGGGGHVLQPGAKWRGDGNGRIECEYHAGKLPPLRPVEDDGAWGAV